MAGGGDHGVVLTGLGEVGYGTDFVYDGQHGVDGGTGGGGGGANAVGCAFEKACLGVLDARNFFACHGMAAYEVDAGEMCLGPVHDGGLGAAGVGDRGVGGRAGAILHYLGDGEEGGGEDD